MAVESLASKAQAVEQIHPRSLKFLSDHLQILIRGRLWAQVLIGMVLGLATGIMIGPTVGWVPAPTAATIATTATTNNNRIKRHGSHHRHN